MNAVKKESAKCSAATSLGTHAWTHGETTKAAIPKPTSRRGQTRAEAEAVDTGGISTGSGPASQARRFSGRHTQMRVSTIPPVLAAYWHPPAARRAIRHRCPLSPAGGSTYAVLHLGARPPAAAPSGRGLLGKAWPSLFSAAHLDLPFFDFTCATSSSGSASTFFTPAYLSCWPLARPPGRLGTFRRSISLA